MKPTPPREADALIAEVRAIREAHAAKFNYDLDAIFQDIRRQQEASGRTYVRYPARRLPPEERANPRPLSADAEA